jgi:hypothetical protein
VQEKPIALGKPDYAIVCKWGNSLGKNSGCSCCWPKGNSNRRKLSLSGNCN